MKQLFRSKVGMGGAITAVAATTTVGTAATTMAGGIIAIGGDFHHTLPKRQTSGAKSEGRFGKQDFAYLPEEDTYRCPAGERLPYRYTNEEDGKMLRRYSTTACQNCSLKSQ